MARVQGYALVEFEKREEAELAIAEMDGSQLLEQDISVTWAFVRGKCTRTITMTSCEHETKLKSRVKNALPTRRILFVFSENVY